MKKTLISVVHVIIILVLATLLLVGCTNSSGSPVTPGNNPSGTQGSNSSGTQGNGSQKNDGTTNTNETLEDLYSFEQISGGYKITGYKGNSQKVEVPEKYNDGYIVAIGEKAFYGAAINTIQLPDTITDIGDEAFANCVSLTSINLPKSLTCIGNRAFSQSGLTSITIPENVSYIDKNAFSNCLSLETVVYNAIEGETPWIEYVEHWGVPAEGFVKTWYSVFDGCKNLSEVKIGNSVKEIPACLFSGLEGITSISIPENIEIIGYGAFYGCKNLTTLYYNAKNAHISYNKNAGSSGYGLIPIFEETSIEQVVFGTTVEAINNRLLWNCVKIRTLNIPDNVTAISADALLNCSGLEELVVGTGLKKVEGVCEDYSDGYALLGAPNIILAELKGVETVTKSMFSRNSMIETLILDSVIDIKRDAFEGCKGLSKIVIADTICSVGVPSSGDIFEKYDTVDKLVFGDCKLLEYNIYENGMYLGNEENPYIYFVRFVDEALLGKLHPDTKCIGRDTFRECSTLDSITLPAGLKSIDAAAFYKCSEIKEIVIPEGVCYIGNRAFCGCDNLCDVVLPKNIEVISEYSFYSTNISSITIPYGVTVIDAHAFEDCWALTQISIPETVKHIDIYAMQRTNIQRVDITSIAAWCQLEECGVNRGKTLSYDLYLNDELLTEVVIPNGVTYIGKDVFDGVKNLTTVTIPKSVEKINRDAFGYCPNLTVINYEGTKTEWTNIELEQDWDIGTGEYIIYCTNGRIAK